MKKIYSLIVFTIVFAQSYGQEKSTDIQSDLADVSINITSANDTYNLDDLKFNARRASVAINKIIASLQTSTTCSKALDLANQISGLLDAALSSDNHGDGRINISESKELITQTFYEYDVCSTKGGDQALSELEEQQSNLRLQQIELELKTKEIKRKLAEQKEKESYLKKQNFIDANKKVAISNLRAFNDQLKACDCNTTMTSNPVGEVKTELISQSFAEIKAYYLDETITLTKTFLANLKSCKN